MRRYRGYHGYRGSPDSGVIGLLIIIGITLLLMPIGGLYLVITQNDIGSKILGWTLIVVGIGIWIVCGTK